MDQEVKNKIFMTIEDHLSLTEFESWLYSQEHLLGKLNQDCILELYTFNYNQKRAKYEFKNTFLKYFDKEEFMLWKVKTNLQDLIDGRETRDRILNDFYRIGYDEVPCIQGLGYYLYELEDADYFRMGKQTVIESLKKRPQNFFRKYWRKRIKTPNLKFRHSDGSLV